MKKAIYTLLFVFCGLTASAQVGTWTGDLDINGNKLTLEFSFNNGTCTLSVPMQGAKDIPTEFSKPLPIMVDITISAINASYKGLCKGDTLISGTFQQNGQTLPLNLRPMQTRKRPQNPTAPFPYTTEEVRWSNNDVSLSGTLTLPQNYTSNTPVVLLITGSGLQNRDEELMEHKPFAVIADVLARNGIATLRYDDRGFGQSTGDVTNATTYDFKDDAKAGIEYLRKRFNHVGTLGHSEGGTIALLLASEQSTDFVISLAGMAASGKETLIKQNHDLLLQNGYSSNIVEEYCTALSDLFQALIDGRTFKNYDSYPLLDKTLTSNLYLVNKQCQTPWWLTFLKLDITSELTKIKCPVLALNGKKDTQVDATQNLTIIRNQLPTAHIIEYDGLNHLFQHCVTGSPSEYINIEETISTDVLDNIINWIKNLKL
ncbi:MAG: alpha/beta fold hydrolase [Bacteroidales bacterium]|nr:alpha/beta fold hydrolase [Bacteroidales bacterium]